MPFCSQCGTSIRDADAFCGSCGARQTAAAPPGAWNANDFLHEISPRNAALLCYIPWIGWLASIVVLASARFRLDRETRFHAFQGLYLFVAWLVVDKALKPFLHMTDAFFVSFPLVAMLKIALFGASIFMIVKTSQNESFKLPFLGELAERSVAEQR